MKKCVRFLNSLQKQKETISRNTTVVNTVREREKQREREKEGKNSENLQNCLSNTGTRTWKVFSSSTQMNSRIQIMQIREINLKAHARN